VLTAWEIIDGEVMDIGPLPDWVTPGQKAMSSNGEVTAHIAMVATMNNDTTVWLSLDPKYKLGQWDPTYALRDPRGYDWKWDIMNLFRVWKPV
jgi:hypothetical protein